MPAPRSEHNPAAPEHVRYEAPYWVLHLDSPGAMTAARPVRRYATRLEAVLDLLVLAPSTPGTQSRAGTPRPAVTATPQERETGVH